MDDDKKNEKQETSYFKVLEEYQGETVSGLALVAAVGLVLSGQGKTLFSGPLTVANVGGALIALAVVLFGAYFLFLIGATLYNGPMKRLAFVKYPILKALILAALMGVIVFLIQGWFGV